MLANLLHVAGVKHVITVDLHASQMQGFFKCPVDNLHAEPLIARWIRHNVLNWKEAVVVSKNAGGTKRVTSLADALKLNFGIVTTDRKRATNMTASMIMNQLDGWDHPPAYTTANKRFSGATNSDDVDGQEASASTGASSRIATDAQGSPRRVNGPPGRPNHPARISTARTYQPLSRASTFESHDAEEEDAQEYNDERAQEVTHGRLIQGHVVADDFPSPAQSETGADGSIPSQTGEDDPMTMSHASSFFVSEPHALGGSGDAGASSDEEEEKLQDPKVEHMITLVGNVKDRPVIIVDDMIDKAGSWIAAAETVVKRGKAKKVYCMATHGVFGADCLDQLQACDCIDQIIVTNSFPISEKKSRTISKLVVLDMSHLLSEAIRRNHYGESISPLFQHYAE
jgi:ribose-phosphate pyrophosphokinase